jgi:catalase
MGASRILSDKPNTKAFLEVRGETLARSQNVSGPLFLPSQFYKILGIFTETSAAVDFEQPRDLWNKVWDYYKQEAYVQNVAKHFKNVISPAIKARQRE